MAKRKPHDPSLAAKLALQRAERDAEIDRLKAMGAEFETDAARRIVSARLSNVFNLLLARKTITANQYDAACQLREDWAAWKGRDGKPEGQAAFVDNGRTPPNRRCLVTDRMIQAGARVVAVLRQLDELSASILTAFMVATVEEDRPMVWRGIMERLGVTVRERQTRAVVAALEALRAIYQEPRRVAA